MSLKNSIIYKTVLAVSTVLILTSSIAGWYVFNSQSELIDKLQADKKQTILKYLAQTQKEKTAQSFTFLKSMAESLTNGITQALYNADTETAEKLVQDSFENENIKAIVIYDESVDEMFLVATYFNGKINYDLDQLDKLQNYDFFKFDLEADDEHIGYFKVFYDNTKVLQEIAKRKDKEISEFQEKVKELNQKIKQQQLNEMLIGAIAGTIVIILMIMLLRKLVNEPLKEFKKGLDSFFEYLKDPSKSVHRIDIDTNDEFGQMSKSVNESIQVSMQMHGEMAQLMLTMDKNVITTETDDKGIITYASSAFCEISGYSK